MSDMIKRETFFDIGKLKDLRGNQENILNLIMHKVSCNKSICYEDILTLYKTVNPALDKQDDYYDHENKCWKYKRVPLDKIEQRQRSLQWFFNNIGVLVRKGYLTVLPRVKLPKQIEDIT